MQAPYVVVVPVKPPVRAKSRLAGLGAAGRQALARAFAIDTVTGCLATPGVGAVLVATDDASFAAELGARGCVTVPDGDTRDLNAALAQAAAEAARRWPASRPLVVCADLPALRPQQLATLLARLDALPDHAAAFVPDASDVGTTVYAATYRSFAPSFGPGSRRAHLRAGGVETGRDLWSIRHDVDDLDDLRAAEALGVGRETAATIAGLLGGGVR